VGSSRGAASDPQPLATGFRARVIIPPMNKLGALLLLAAFASGACKKKPPPSNEVMTVKVDLRELAGAKVTIAGKSDVLVNAGEMPFVVLAFDKLPAPLPMQMQIEVPTPCGPKPLTVPVDVKEQFPGRVVLQARVDHKEIPATTAVWIDAAPGTAVVVGKATLLVPKSGEQSRQVFVKDLACAPQHDVSIGGTKVGTLDGTNKDEIFITTQTSACYQVATKTYGTASPAQSKPQVLRGQQVYRFSGGLSYFLGSAPRKIGVLAGTKEAYVSDLTKIACP
jgi:hypothetical protein